MSRGIMKIIPLIVILTRKSLKKQTASPAVFFLALADFGFSVIILPFQAARFALKTWPTGLLPGNEGGIGCKLFAILKLGNAGSSILILSLIGVNRALILYNHVLGTGSMSSWNFQSLKT